jgi:hypothetical protein
MLKLKLAILAACLEDFVVTHGFTNKSFFRMKSEKCCHMISCPS